MNVLEGAMGVVYCLPALVIMCNVLARTFCDNLILPSLLWLLFVVEL
jgi:hypothetical protein